ncbi:hypothetical protein LJC63_07850 [Ruminococcaceae bacterium OttesenSCG-928-L11]|nr:hypothetical protein [Ruminococcaceae bacterium OttesenSCG-928-L11]
MSPACKYRFRGSVRYVDGDAVIDFDLSEPETITPDGLIYPDSWGGNFGRDYYLHKVFRSTSQCGGGPVTQSLYSTEPDVHPTPTETLRAEISALLEMMQSSEADNGTESGASL